MLKARNQEETIFTISKGGGSNSELYSSNDNFQTKLAWTTWSLLANNPVKKMFYLGFLAIQLVISLYYSANLVQQVHSQNRHIQTPPTNTSISVQLPKGGLQMAFLSNFDNLLTSLIAQNSVVLSIVLTSLVFLTLMVIAMFVFKTNIAGGQNKIKITELSNSSFTKQGLTILLVAFRSFLFMPFFDVFVRILNEHQYSSDLSDTDKYIGYGICSFGILCLAVLMQYLNRFFTLSVPSEDLPWAEATSKLPHLVLTTDLLLVIFNTLLSSSRDFTFFKVIILFLLFSVQSLYRLIIMPVFLKEVDFILKFRDFTLTLLFFLGVICRAMEDQHNLDMIYLIMMVPIGSVGWVMVGTRRKGHVIEKIVQGKVKMEADVEYGMYTLMQVLSHVQVNEKRGNNKAIQKNTGVLLKLLLSHYEQCTEPDCKCEEFHTFIEYVQISQLGNPSALHNSYDQYKYLKIADIPALYSSSTALTKQLQHTSNNNSHHHYSQSAAMNSPNRARQSSKKFKALGVGTIKEESPGSNQPIALQLLEKSNNESASELPQQDISQNDQPHQKQEKHQNLLENSSQNAQYTYFSSIISMIIHEVTSKFQQSSQIQLLLNYFTLIYLNKDILTVYQMLSFNKNKLSRTEQCQYIINELYLLSKVEQYQNSSNKTNQVQLDPDMFLQYNDLQYEFNKVIQGLGNYITWFWKGFTVANIEITKTLNISSTIAKLIKSLYKIFGVLSEMNGQKDVSIFFRFAQVQLRLLNDPIESELYMVKVKRIIEMNQIYEKTGLGAGFAQNSQLLLGASQGYGDNTDFILVEANSQSFGQILKVSNNIKNVIGWLNEECNDNSRKYHIESIMPSSIRSMHYLFLKKFFKTGKTKIMNKLNTWFIKNTKGFIFPVELFIKFHYSTLYGYTFFAIIKPVTQLSPFLNLAKYPLDQLYFIITDADEGFIQEYSESWVSLLAAFGFDLETLDGTTISKRIQELILDFDHGKLQATRSQRLENEEIYERDHILDLSIFTENESQLNKALQSQNRFKLNFHTRIFEETYAEGILKMNIYCFSLLDNMDYILPQNINTKENRQGGLPQISRDKQACSKKELTVSNSNKIGGELFSFQVQNQPSIQQSQDNSVELMNNQLESFDSHSGGSSTSSTNNASSSLAMFRNSHLLTDNTTPRTLS